MRCYGITKRLARCKNESSRPFCRHHRFQPFIVLFSLVSIIATIGSFYHDVMKPIGDLAGGSSPTDVRSGPDLVATLPLMIGGFFVRVANKGDTTAHNVYVEVVSWGEHPNREEASRHAARLRHEVLC